MNTTPNQPSAEELLRSISIEREPIAEPQFDRLTPDNIRDPSLSKDEIIRVINADPYFDDTPTEDDGVYRRRSTIALPRLIILVVIAIAILIVLFYLASVLV